MYIKDKAQYDELVEKIGKCVKYYDKLKFENNKFTLGLANGDQLTARVLKNNIAHLLGVKLDNLKRYNIFKKNMNAYECLNCFIEDSYSFYRLVSQGQLSYDEMFSKNVYEKIDAFSTNINIRTDDIYCIIKYDGEKTYQIEEHAEKCDYYIVRKNNDKYYIMGLIKNEQTENNYVPVTSRKYDNSSEFDEFMRRIAIKQEITYPYSLNVQNIPEEYNKSFKLSQEDRLKLVNSIATMCNNYNATSGVIKDFTFSLNRQNNDYVVRQNTMTVLRVLAENIKNGNVLDESTITDLCGDIMLPDDVINIINTCNDVLCSSNNNDKALTNYSELNDENKSLKKELKEMKEQLTKYQEEINDFKIKNEVLKEENNSYFEKLNILDEAFVKVKSMNKETNI